MMWKAWEELGDVIYLWRVLPWTLLPTHQVP
jgi:hypothetical protein